MSDQDPKPSEPLWEMPEAEAPPEPEPEPKPESPPEPVATPPEPEPTPVVPPSEASWRTPPGTAAPSPGPLGDGTTALERPEVQAGLAFVGGLVVAGILRKLGRK